MLRISSTIFLAPASAASSGPASVSPKFDSRIDRTKHEGNNNNTNATSSLRRSFPASSTNSFEKSYLLGTAAEIKGEVTSAATMAAVMHNNNKQVEQQHPQQHSTSSEQNNTATTSLLESLNQISKRKWLNHMFSGEQQQHQSKKNGTSTITTTNEGTESSSKLPRELSSIGNNGGVSSTIMTKNNNRNSNNNTKKTGIIQLKVTSSVANSPQKQQRENTDDENMIINLNGEGNEDHYLKDLLDSVVINTSFTPIEVMNDIIFKNNRLRQQAHHQSEEASSSSSNNINNDTNTNHRSSSKRKIISTLTPRQQSALLLRQLRRVAHSFDNNVSPSLASIGQEDYSWKTSSKTTAILTPERMNRTQSQAKRMRKHIRRLNDLEKRLETFSASSSSPSLIFSRTKLRKAALLRDTESATKILFTDMMTAPQPAHQNKNNRVSSIRSRLTTKDFHVAMASTRVLRFDRNSNIINTLSSTTNTNFNICVKIYKKMIKMFNGMRQQPLSPITVSLLANAASFPKEIEMVYGMWKAMLLSRSSVLFDSTPAILATSAIIRAIGRSFRFDKIVILEERQEIIREIRKQKKQQQQLLEEAEEGNDEIQKSKDGENENDNDDGLEQEIARQRKKMGGDGGSSSSELLHQQHQLPPSVISTFSSSPLEMIESTVKELFDSMPQHQHHFNTSTLLQASIAIALADLGESRHLGQVLSRFFRKASAGTSATAGSNKGQGKRSKIRLEDDDLLGDEAASSVTKVVGSTMKGTLKLTRSAVQFYSLPYESCLISALNTVTLNKIVASAENNNDSSISSGEQLQHQQNPEELVKAAIVEVLETFVQEISRQRSPPPSVSNMVLSSLLLYSLTTTSPADEAVTLALQGCFFVVGAMKRFRLGFDGETVRLLLRALEGTALVTVALDPENTMDPSVCLSLLQSAENFVSSMMNGSLVCTTTTTTRNTNNNNSNHNNQVFLLEECTSLTFLMSMGTSVLHSFSEEEKKSSSLAIVSQIEKSLAFLNQATSFSISSIRNESDLRSLLLVDPTSSAKENNKNKKIALVLGTFPVVVTQETENDIIEQEDIILSSLKRVCHSSEQYTTLLVSQEVFHSYNFVNNNNDNSNNNLTSAIAKFNDDNPNCKIQIATPYAISILHSSVARNEILGGVNNTDSETNNNTDDGNHNNDKNTSLSSSSCHVFQMTDLVEDFIKTHNNNGNNTSQQSISRFCKVHKDGLDNCPTLSDDFWAQEAVRLRPPPPSPLHLQHGNNNINNNNNDNSAMTKVKPLLEESPYENFRNFLYRPMMENLLMVIGDGTSTNNNKGHHQKDAEDEKRSGKKSSARVAVERNADDMLKVVMKRWSL